MPSARTVMFPGLSQFRSYDRGTLRADLLSALTVTALLIPSGLAYGELAGLSPVSGLYTGVLAMACYPLFATSRTLIVGPESQMAILVAAAIAPLAAGDPARYAALAAMMALVCAAICLVAALARLGFLADYLSQPVLVGYLTGVALIILANQAAKLIGTTTSGSTLLELLRGLWQNQADADLPSALVGVTTIAVILLLRRYAPQVPASLVAVALMTAASAILDLSAQGVSVVGTVPGGVPSPQIPQVTLREIGSLIGPALGLSVVLFANTVLTARAYAQRAGTHRIDPNRELSALASANVGVGLFQGFPIGCSDSRTAVNYSNGGRTQAVSLFAAVFTAGFLMLFTPLVKDLPSPTLAGVVMVAAWGMLRPQDFIDLREFRRFEYVLAIVTLVGVSIFGILPGILLAVGLNLLDIVYRLSRPSASVLGPVEGSSRWRAVPAEQAAESEPGLLVLRYDAPLFYANAEFVLDHVQSSVKQRGEQLRWVVLNLEAAGETDSNGLQTLEQLADFADSRKLVLALARLKSPLEEDLRRGGIWDRFSDHVYDRVEDAAEAYRRATDG